MQVKTRMKQFEWVPNATPVNLLELPQAKGEWYAIIKEQELRVMREHLLEYAKTLCSQKTESNALQESNKDSAM
jgi:hypothetical protein